MLDGETHLFLLNRLLCTARTSCCWVRLVRITPSILSIKYRKHPAAVMFPTKHTSVSVVKKHAFYESGLTKKTGLMFAGVPQSSVKCLIFFSIYL